MRSFQNKKIKTAAVILLSALVLAAVGGAFYFVRWASFSTFCENLAKNSLSSNPLKLHYTLAEPENMGYGDISRDLSGFDPEAYEQNAVVWQAYLARLEGYDPDKLSEEEAFTWQMLRRYFTLEGELSTYLYYESLLSPADGAHIQMPVLLAEYAFYDREDVENYLTLLSQLPDYFRGLLTYTKLQAQAGILQYEGNLEKTAEQCGSILTLEQLDEGTHFLQTTFEERIAELMEAETEALTDRETDEYMGEETIVATDEKATEITEEEAAAWIEKNNQLLLELAGVYAELQEGLVSIAGTDEIAGLSAYPDGARYYALLLQEVTGSDRTVEEMKELLYARFEELYAEYKEVITDGNVIAGYDFPLESEADMLTDLYARTQEDFPTFQSDAGQSAASLTGAGNANGTGAESEPTDETGEAKNGVSWIVTLKPVDEGLEDMMAPAFYLTPPVDRNQENTIYINVSDGYEGLSLYTTLAHEGFPGHLYQTVYSQNAMMENDVPFIRQILYFGGYTEGWGIYAESYAYEYAADLLEEAYGDVYGDTVRAAQLNRELQLCLCSILDIFIHYDGATLSQVQKLLESLGFGSGNIAAVYETICNTPANYPKYYLGYLEILELKALAFERDANLTDKEFHQWLLSAGPADFSSLRTRLISFR